MDPHGGSYQSTEKSIVQVRAVVMLYDDARKEWLQSGGNTGLSKVHIYQHSINNTFRIVGKNTTTAEREITINCMIAKNLRYNQATPTFHQWRDNRQVYGLNFSSQLDADQFAEAMLKTLELLRIFFDDQGKQKQVSRSAPKKQHSVEASLSSHFEEPCQSFQQSAPTNAATEDDHLYDNYTDLKIAEDFEIESRHESESGFKRKTSNTSQQGISTTSATSPPVAPTTASLVPSSQVIAKPKSSVGSSASLPVIPPATSTKPKSAKVGSTTSTSSGAPSSGAPIPPPPPPPPPPPAMPHTTPQVPSTNADSSRVVAHNSDDDQSISLDGSSAGLGLAAAIRGAKLRKVTKIEVKQVEPEAAAVPTLNYAAASGTIGRSAGPPIVPAKGNIMSEMARKLEARKAKAESFDTEITNINLMKSTGMQKINSRPNSSTTVAVVEKTSPNMTSQKGNVTNNTNHVTSPYPAAEYRCSMTSQISAQLESIRQDLLAEIKNEFQRIKQEIIEAVVMEMNKQSSA